jgi:hypothetical protein
VGRIHFDNQDEWLLVEAKGHVGEIKSSCGATNPLSQKKIYSAIEKTSQVFGNPSEPIKNWLEPYYQYANRLSVLYFLMKECNPAVNARLLFIYFYGENMENAICPQNEQECLPEIQKMNKRLGVNKDCELAQRVHSLFLPVNPAGLGARSKSKGG